MAGTAAPAAVAERAAPMSATERGVHAWSQGRARSRATSAAGFRRKDLSTSEWGQPDMHFSFCQGIPSARPAGGRGPGNPAPPKDGTSACIADMPPGNAHFHFTMRGGFPVTRTQGGKRHVSNETTAERGLVPSRVPPRAHHPAVTTRVGRLLQDEWPQPKLMPCNDLRVEAESRPHPPQVPPSRER